MIYLGDFISFVKKEILKYQEESKTLELICMISVSDNFLLPIFSCYLSPKYLYQNKAEVDIEIKKLFDDICSKYKVSIAGKYNNVIAETATIQLQSIYRAVQNSDVCVYLSDEGGLV